MSKKAKKRVIQDDSDEEEKTKPIPSYLKAGEDFIEMKKRGALNIDMSTDDFDMDLLMGTPPKKSKKSKKDKEKKETKLKSSAFAEPVDDGDIHSLTDEEEEEEDEEAMQKVREDMHRMQRNRNREARLKQMNAPDEAAELQAYLDANRTTDEDLESSAIFIEEEDPNKIQTVMVRWRFGGIEKHKMKMTQPFESLFDLYAEKEKIDVSCVSFETSEGTQIYPTDTLKKLKLRVVDVVDGSILHKTDDQETDNENIDKDDGKIDLKFQLKNQKEHICVRIYPHNPLKKAVLQVSTKLNIPAEKMKLHFDGDVVDLEDTPTDLDLDGGEVFDVTILD